MDKPKIIVALGSVTALIGIWFFATERSYASTSRECMYGSTKCLAEVLQWLGIGQVLVGIAIVLIGLHLKNEK